MAFHRVRHTLKSVLGDMDMRPDSTPIRDALMDVSGAYSENIGPEKIVRTTVILRSQFKWPKSKLERPEQAIRRGRPHLTTDGAAQDLPFGPSRPCGARTPKRITRNLWRHPNPGCLRASRGGSPLVPCLIEPAKQATMQRRPERLVRSH